MSRESVNSQDTQMPPGVGLLHKAFHILDMFSDERPLWTQKEIGEATNLTRSTVSRLVRFLCARGFLSYQTDSKRYTLGIGAMELGRRAQAQFDLTSIAIDILEELSRQTLETVILTGLRPPTLEIVCLHQIPSRHGGLRVFENVGATFPLYAGATAKPVLAHLQPHLADRVFDGPMPPVNPAHVPDRVKLVAELDTIRHQGFALSFEETYPGVAGIGAALLDPGGNPRGSIAIAAPLQRLSEKITHEFSVLVSNAAIRINERLAGRYESGVET